MMSAQSKISASFQDSEAILIILDGTFMTCYNKHRSWTGKTSLMKALKASGKASGFVIKELLHRYSK